MTPSWGEGTFQKCMVCKRQYVGLNEEPYACPACWRDYATKLNTKLLEKVIELSQKVEAADHIIVQCACGRILLQCACDYPNKPIIKMSECNCNKTKKEMMN